MEMIRKMPAIQNVYIMRGASGSGKSTHARENFTRPIILSSDDFWLLDGPDYKNNFNPSRLGEAHAWNLRRFALYIVGDAKPYVDSDLVVDNTNTTVAEIAPYYALAHAFGYPVQIITLDTDPKVAFARNIHGVPEAAHRRQVQNLRANNSIIPPYWNHKVI